MPYEQDDVQTDTKDDKIEKALHGQERHRIELLAPVGKWDVLEAVIAAGADAVYLGGKKYNMRLHRKDLNFTDEELRAVVAYAHGRRVPVYVTVNNLLTDAEIDELAGYLQFLEEIAADGIIVQDLGVVQLARDMGLRVPLHASVMMNAHNLEGLRLLEELGVSRVILGREVTLADIRLWHGQTRLELEYFAHGDMCFSQSSQCYLSGMLFGESSNRGRCLKPCRWPWELVDRDTGAVLAPRPESSGTPAGRYLLAIKDMCLLPFLPEVIAAGVRSLKIEGRMREAGFVAALTGFYRRALDRYYADPCSYQFDWEEFRELEQMRVRDLSPYYAFGNPGPSAVGYTGEREPRFFSKAVPEPVIRPDDLLVNPLAADVGSRTSEVRKDENKIGAKEDDESREDEESGTRLHGRSHDASDSAHPLLRHPAPGSRRPILAVKAGSLEAALAALEHGAELIYTSGESWLSQPRPWRPGDYAELVAAAHLRGGKREELGENREQPSKALVIVGMPRIAMPAEMDRIKALLEIIRESQPLPDGILVTNLGTVLAARATGLPLYADYSCNIANGRAAALLQSCGVVQATAPLEFRAEEILALPARTPLALEAIVHGELPGMISDHCLPAALLDGGSRYQICSGACRRMRLGLRDATGAVHPLEIDTDCRNHLYMACELALLPYLRSFYGSGFTSLRLEIPHYNAAEAGAVTALYRAHIYRIWSDPDAYVFPRADWDRLLQARGGPFGTGPYTRGVITEGRQR
jgi:putative protease